MEEKKTANNAQNTKNVAYILVALGFVLVVAAYFMVWQKYDQKITDIDSEIDTLSVRKAELESLKKDEAKIKAEIEENKAKVQTILSRYNGGISYESQIMDAYNLTQKYNIQIPSLGLTPVVSEYQFAQGDIAGYSGDSMSYNITAIGSYDDIKKLLKDLTVVQTSKDARRKVMQTVGFDYDSTEQKMTVSLAMKEYAISGGDREMSPVNINGYQKKINNIFYTETLINQ